MSKSSQSGHTDDVPSPCIQVCALDAAGICSGCLRSIDEIAQWGAATPIRRRAILERVAQRRAAGAPDMNRAQGADR